jgi:3-oxo-5-alpha-steroid 4-dehydrogenase 3
MLFLWAFYHQYKATVLLANLRKDKKGSIVTLEHQVPQGDWFELVSSPHNLAEILMYFALTFILLGSNTWPVVFLWVLSNQVSHAVYVPNILICYESHFFQF